MGDVYVVVSIKGRFVGSVTVQSDGEPSIFVRWKTGESMYITGPAMLVFRHGHRTIILYWDGVVLRDRTQYTCDDEFPRCAPCIHANASEFCEASSTIGGFWFDMPRYFEQCRTIDDIL